MKRTALLTLVAAAGSVVADSILLINCVSPNGNVPGQGYFVDQSLMGYYPDGASENSAPSSGNTCYPNDNDGIAFEVIWEQSQGVHCTFPTGVSVGFSIAADAQSRSDYSNVGGGCNSDAECFQCYKDNQRTVYTTVEDIGPSGGAVTVDCNSIYYCIGGD